MMDLIKQQNQLHVEGQKVLEELALLSELKKYGQPIVVGSFALDLLTRRDIDIEVIVSVLDKKQVSGICSYLVSLDLPRMDLTVMDNTVEKVPQLPNSYYVGIKYIDKNIPFNDRNARNPLAWQIDIHFLKKEDSKATSKGEEIKRKLTSENKLTILEIKYAMATNSNYHRTVFSTDIYDSILDHGVSSMEEFKQYMKQKGIKL